MLCLLGFALPAKHSAFLVLRLVLFQKMFVQFNICVLTSCLTRSYTLLQTEGTFSDYVHIDCVGGNSTSPIIRLYRHTPCCVIVGSVRFHVSGNLEIWSSLPPPHPMVTGHITYDIHMPIPDGQTYVYHMVYFSI